MDDHKVRFTCKPQALNTLRRNTVNDVDEVTYKILNVWTLWIQTRCFSAFWNTFNERTWPSPLHSTVTTRQARGQFKNLSRGVQNLSYSSEQFKRTWRFSKTCWQTMHDVRRRTYSGHNKRQMYVNVGIHIQGRSSGVLFVSVSFPLLMCYLNTHGDICVTYATKLPQIWYLFYDIHV